MDGVVLDLLLPALDLISFLVYFLLWLLDFLGWFCFEFHCPVSDWDLGLRTAALINLFPSCPRVFVMNWALGMWIASDWW